MKSKLHNVEFLRFAFAVGLVYYHLLRANLVSTAPDPSVYARLVAGCGWACLLVECFCILSGWFLPASVRRSSHRPFVGVVLGRFFRLWPVFAVQTLLWVFFFRLPAESAALHLLFLHGTGLSPEFRGILWFVPSFFWASVFLHAVLRSLPRNKAALVLALVAFLGYALNLGHTHGGLGRETVCGFLSLGLARIAAGISLGALLSMAAEDFRHAFPPRVAAGRRRRAAASGCFTLLELSAVALLAKWLFAGHAPFRNPMVVVALFSFLMGSFAARAGWVSRLLDRPVFDRLGQYAYSIYVSQQVAFFLLAKTLWTRTDSFAAHPMAFLALSAVLAVSLGILAFHLVERPAASAWRRWETSHVRSDGPPREMPHGAA